MARTPTLERPTSLKILGVGFIALALFFVWLTAAFFNKSFVQREDITILAPTSGQQLPDDADVKLRGMIVGEVRSVRTTGDGVALTVGIKPEMMKDIPAGVTAQILPKTLFGEKFVALIPPETENGESLQAGDTIAKANVPIELETVLNDLFSLLEAVDPAQVSATLSAVSEALDGRGEKLGETLVNLNSYLGELNPDVPQLVDDIQALGQVSDVYAAALPDLGRVLENVVVTGNTVVEKKTQLTTFFAEASGLADTLNSFVAASGQDLIDINANSRRALDVTADYSVTFPCFLGALDTITGRLNSVMRDNAVHINLKVIPPISLLGNKGTTPTPYTDDERLVVSFDKFNSPEYADLVKPSCLQLKELTAGQDVFGGKPYNLPDERIYDLLNITSSHNKFFGADNQPAGGVNRVAAASGAALAGVDSPAERAVLNSLIGASLNTSGQDLPDIASLLLSPALRGSEVSISEAR